MSMIQLIENGRVSPADFALWSVMDYYTNERGECDASNAELAKSVRMTVRYTQTILKRLVKVGALKIRNVTGENGAVKRHLVPLTPKGKK